MKQLPPVTPLTDTPFPYTPLFRALVRAVTFGSLVAAGLPLLTALIGIGVAMAGITIATGFIDLSSASMTLALMIGLAVGIDYALFIVDRKSTRLNSSH